MRAGICSARTPDREDFGVSKIVMRLSIIRCKTCGKPESAHHHFRARMPFGCKCDPREWDDFVSNICNTYMGDGHMKCQTCEHDFACHAEDATRAAP